MALQLTHDRVGGVGGELDATVGLEPVDRFQQPHRRHLHEVVEWLAAVAEPAGEVLGEAKVGLDQLRPKRGVTALRELGELVTELLAFGGVEGHPPAA